MAGAASCSHPWNRSVHVPQINKPRTMQFPTETRLPPEHKLQLSVSWQPVVSRISRRLKIKMPSILIILCSHGASQVVKHFTSNPHNSLWGLVALLLMRKLRHGGCSQRARAGPGPCGPVTCLGPRVRHRSENGLPCDDVLADVFVISDNTHPPVTKPKAH